MGGLASLWLILYSDAAAVQEPRLVGAARHLDPQLRLSRLPHLARPGRLAVQQDAGGPVWMMAGTLSIAHLYLRL